MKILTSAIAVLALALCTSTAVAQKVKVTSGNPDILKSETSVNVEFTYDNISVGKYKTEKEYVDAKTEEYNKKEPGKGDTWAKSWASDKKGRYEPKFIELFTLNSQMAIKKDAKYTIIVKLISIEPGYNVGISRKNAEID